MGAMGGTAEARRSELGGLAVTLDLPLGEPPRRAGRGALTAAGATVLVVEDDEETRAVLVRELGSRGYRTQEAADGRTALERWAAGRPDVILLDLGLPDMDGLEVIRRVRRDATTPIVILSGRYAEREKVEALERGRGRLRDEALRARRAPRPAARGHPALDRPGGRYVGNDHRRRAHLRPGRAPSSGSATVSSTSRPREFELLRVLLGRAGPRRHQGQAPARGLGAGVPGRGQLRLRPRQPAAPQACRRRSGGELRDLIVTEPGIGYRVRGPDVNLRQT